MEFKKKDFYTIEDMLQIMEMLRDPVTGCEWDSIQTHESIRQNFIEETYEAVDAIDKKDVQLLQEELGDVLLQVLYHAQFKKEEGVFDFHDVVNALAQKLVLRHPHVFKDEDIHGVDNILHKWEEIKNESHGHTTVSRTLNAVPKSFPALMYAQKVQKRVQAGKLPVPSQKQEIAAVRRLLDKMEQDAGSGALHENDLSELLFRAVNMTRTNKMDAEEILAKKSRNFVKIFNIFEDLALQKDIRFDTIDTATLKELWIQAEAACKK
ncbi:MAG: nucleoside triphosphate pyrophosphohydrolase [Oscillospiraceae bacterium]|nr:nucleoside triphosphate pyrophosphohydrolase [Oscillospiraceae bacterium]